MLKPIDRKYTGMAAFMLAACLCLALSPFRIALAEGQAKIQPPAQAQSQSDLQSPPLVDGRVSGADEKDASSAPMDPTALLATANAKRQVYKTDDVPDDNFPTLFFTAWQHALLQEAKIGYKTSRPEGELGSGAEPEKKDPGIREISLGGIAFSSSKKWTVWLNGVRVTPDAIPEQVLDIKVSSDFIDLKWFDKYTNRIYPIRLRPQERFNLDARIFLPGTGAM